MRRVWIAAALVAMTVGVILDRFDWFPGFFAGFVLGLAIARFDRSRTHGERGERA